MFRVENPPACPDFRQGALEWPGRECGMGGMVCFALRVHMRPDGTFIGAARSQSFGGAGLGEVSMSWLILMSIYVNVSLLRSGAATNSCCCSVLLSESHSLRVRDERVHPSRNDLPRSVRHCQQPFSPVARALDAACGSFSGLSCCDVVLVPCSFAA